MKLILSLLFATILSGCATIHMDAAKEDPKNASEHKTAIADLATKIDDYITKLEKIEKSKKEIEKKEDKKDKK